MALLHDLNTHHKNSFSLSRHRHKGIFQHTILKDNNFCWAFFEMSEVHYYNQCNNAVLTSTMHLYLFRGVAVRYLYCFRSH